MSKRKPIGKPYAFAPIAEYLGVAICEKDGNKRASWLGVEYTTDGHAYLVKHPSNGTVGLEQLPPVPPHSAEAVAKYVIDEMTPAQRSEYANWKEAYFIITKETPPATTPRYSWDETAQVFVEGK